MTQSERDTFPCRFPMAGPTLVARSPADRVPSHGTHHLGQTYAFDFCGVEPPKWSVSERSFGRALLGAIPLSSCFGWGRGVAAASAGLIAKVHDGEPEPQRINLAVNYIRSLPMIARRRPTLGSLVGNYVIVKHGEVFSLYAHLRRGSICVAEGGEVASGEKLGEVGH